MGYFQKILRIMLVGTIGTLLLYMFLVGRITLPPDLLGVAVFWLIVGWLFESAFGNDGGSARRTYYRDYTPHNDTNNFEFDGHSDDAQKEEGQKRQEQEAFNAYSYYEKQKQEQEEEKRRWQEMQDQKEAAFREEQERKEEEWREQQEKEQEWREAQRQRAEDEAAWAREQEKNAQYERDRDYYHNYGNAKEEDAKRFS